MEDIRNIHLPLYSNLPDHPHWVGSQDGKFTVVAAYETLNIEDTDANGWTWIWKLKIPQKLKGFSWLIP